MADDHVAEYRRRVQSYVDDVVAGRRVVGRLERLAVERHRRDVDAPRGMRFDDIDAADACWWIENSLRFSKGEWAGKPFVLAPWQVFVVWSLFGWKRTADGVEIRRFRTAYVSVARKNGKSELAAAIGLLMLVVFGEAGGEVYSAATKKDQASIVWRQAAGMVKRSPLLKSEIGVHESRYNLAHYESESRFEAVAADANTLDGLGPLCAIVDEYHAHPTSDVFDVLESGMGARREPLMLVITTAGGKRDGACYDLESDAVKILERNVEGDDLFAYVARLDDADDWSNEAVWPKANPNLGVSAHPEKIRIAAKVAKRRPSAQNEFLRKHMNLWTETSTAWLPMPVWDACSAAVQLGARRAWVGLDLSAVGDYTAAVAVLEPESDGVWDVIPGFWIPEETLLDRVRTDRVPVNRWVEQELVVATPGDVIDQDAVKDWLLNLRERYDVVEVPMDPHNATKLQTELLALGFPVVSMRQGWITMSPAIKATEALIRQQKIRHGGHPVLRWMVGNVALKRDESENLRFHKARSGDRIDGVVALAMALGRAQLAEEYSGGMIWGVA